MGKRRYLWDSGNLRSNLFKYIKSSINFLLVLEYVSFDFSQLCQKFQDEINFSLPENDKSNFSLHMRAKPSFAHRLQTAKMASY